MSGFSKTFTLMGIAAASFAPRFGAAQNFNGDLGGIPASALEVPGGGLQISCIRERRTMVPEKITYFFNKRIADDTPLDTLMPIKEILFDKITVYPQLKKLEYTDSTQWFSIPGSYDMFDGKLPSDSISWKDGLNEEAEAWASYFIDAGEEFCRRKTAPVSYTLISDDMMMQGDGKRFVYAMKRIKNILGVK